MSGIERSLKTENLLHRERNNMTYKKIEPLNTAWNRKFQFLQEENLLVLLMQKNGMSYFMLQKPNKTRTFYSCSDEVFDKNFKILDNDVYIVIEDLTALKFTLYP